MNPPPVSTTCPQVDPSQTHPSHPLKRGKACVVCRTLKIKCDGVRPVCGSCECKPKATKCNWDDNQNRSRVAILIATIKSLEARIFELEHPELVAPVTLHYPYSRDVEETSTRLGMQAPIPNPPFPIANLSSNGYWDAASTDGSVSSPPLPNTESFTGYPMELRYASVSPPSASASRNYQYSRDNGPHVTNPLM